MPETTQKVLPAPVFWAQRSNLVYLKIAVEDVESPEIKVDKHRVYYRGVGGTTKQEYEANLELFDEIRPDESKFIVRDRGTEFVLIKEKEGPYWQRLLKDKQKFHWLKIDFNKWKAEDDSDDEAQGGGGGGGGMGGGGGGGGGPGGADFEDMMRQMGGLGGMGGMPGMGGMGGMPGMGGLGGMGMPDLGDLDDKEDGGPDSDDEDLPDLEEK